MAEVTGSEISQPLHYRRNELPRSMQISFITSVNKPANLDSLPIHQENRTTINRLKQTFQTNGVTLSSVSELICLLGGRDFINIDLDSPVKTVKKADGQDMTVPNLLPTDDKRSQNFALAQEYIKRVLIEERPDILRYCREMHHAKSPDKLPDDRIRRLAVLEPPEKNLQGAVWSDRILYQLHLVQTRPDLFGPWQKANGERPLNTDIIRLVARAVETVRQEKMMALPTDLREIKSPLESVNLLPHDLMNYLGYIGEQAFRYREKALTGGEQDIKNYSVMTGRSNQVLKSAIQSVLKASALGEVQLSHQERKVLEEAIVRDDLANYLIFVRHHPSRALKSNWKQNRKEAIKTHSGWWKILDKKTGQLIKERSPLLIGIPGESLEAIKKKIDNFGFSYEEYLKRLHSRRVFISAAATTMAGIAAGTTSFSAHQLEPVSSELKDMLSGLGPCIAIDSRNKTDIRDPGSLTRKYIEERGIYEKGDQIMSLAQQRLYDWTKTNHPEAFVPPQQKDERLTVIQPADLEFQPPPQEVGSYLESENRPRLTDGLKQLYYQGLIKFGDETPQVEFLTTDEVNQQVDRLTQQLAQRIKGLKPKTKISTLNQDRKVENVLNSNTAVVEEILYYFTRDQGNPFTEAGFLPAHSTEKGYDNYPQIEAARKRGAYYDAQYVLGQMTNTAFNWGNLSYWPGQFINKAGELEQKGEVDLEEIRTFVDPEKFFSKCQPNNPQFKMPITPLLFGLVIRAANGKNVNEVGFPNRFTRRDFLKLTAAAGATAITIGAGARLTSKLLENPVDPVFSVLLKTYPDVLPLAVARLPYLMDVPSTKQSASLAFYDKTGTAKVGEYAPGGFRERISYDEIPEEFIRILLGIEDPHFFEHAGVDGKATLRAVLGKVSGNALGGGSGITQQLVKQLAFSEEEREPQAAEARKKQEIPLALLYQKALENKLGGFRKAKEYILEQYLNISPFGGNFNGLKAASEHYFGKKPNQLTKSEMVFLAGLPQSPGRYYPYGNPENAIDQEDKLILKDDHPARLRQKAVLGLLVQNGIYTQQEADLIFQQPITINKISETNSTAPELFDYCLALTNKNAPHLLKQGAEIKTSIDLELQRKLADRMKKYLDQADIKARNIKEGLAIVMDAKTGRIEGYYGDFRQEILPGSAVKPFTYALAIEDGMITDGETQVDDSLLTTTGPDGSKFTFKDYGDVWSDKPKKFGYAFRHSLNIPALRTAQQLGIKMPGGYERFGLIKSLKAHLKHSGLPDTLGVNRLPLINLASAYASLANHGQFIAPGPILSIRETQQGKSIYEAPKKRSGKSVLDPSVADTISQILSSREYLKEDDGTIAGSWSLLDGRFAIKTGTSNDGPTHITAAGYTLGENPKVVIVTFRAKQGEKLTPDTTCLVSATPFWREFVTDYLI